MIQLVLERRTQERRNGAREMDQLVRVLVKQARRPEFNSKSHILGQVTVGQLAWNEPHSGRNKRDPA